MRPKQLVAILVFSAILLAVTLALALPASPARAGGVVSVCDETHLRAALAEGGAVTFACSGTITLASTLTIAADTTIDGSGQAVTISGGNAVRVFMVNSGVSLSLNRLTIANGQGNAGGGIYNSGTLTVTDSTFSGNRAQSYGGAIFSIGEATVTDSTFSGNSAYNFSAGGILNDGAMTVTDCTFTGNSSGNSGGGIRNDGTLTVVNSTFFANDGGGHGGGIFNNGTVSVSNSTFSGNSASSGGGFYIYHGVATLRNTIVANSLSAGNCYIDSSYDGKIIDGGGNLSSDGTCPGIQNTDPMLGPLQDNGDPTHTMALHPNSPAIDAANNATCAAAPVSNLDQRGLPRPVDADGDGVASCDIGAYEFQLQPFSFVRTASTGAGDCSSWADACSLQTALTVTDGEIWAAAGVYTPTYVSVPVDLRTAAFEFNHGVAVYGGFEGHETARDQRDWAANPTVLSGDLNQDDQDWSNMDDNAYHVVICRAVVTGTVILDGFTITRGRANMTQMPEDGGGGILNQCSDLRLSNLTITWNRAFYGGGIANQGSSPSLLDVVIANNYARYRGGGMYNAAGSPTLTNLSVYDNEADHAYDNTFGGGIYIVGGNPILTNLSLYHNEAKTGGGGIYIFGGSPTLTNSIVWENQPGQINGNVTVTYSDIQNGYSGAGNISSDPSFVDADSRDLRLSPGSPAIDAGNNAATGLAGITTDLDGFPRFVNNPWVTDTGSGAAPLIDMGAFEWHFPFTLYLPLVRR